jgi:hypothetical protein
VGDETILKLSELYLTGRCAFTKLRLAGNSRISGVGVGKLGQSLQGFPEIEEISLRGVQVAPGGIKYLSPHAAASPNWSASPACRTWTWDSSATTVCAICR